MSSTVLIAIDSNAVREPPAPGMGEGIEYLIGTSPAMQEMYRTLTRLMNNDLTITIIGEAGTGKELVARALHQMGKRQGPFVAVHMPQSPENESPVSGTPGGTLFLDDIADMPMAAQTALLRRLQQNDFAAAGTRIICATRRDLMQQVKNGAFNEDLYYRLNAVPLRMPPLRERREDIAPLANYFLRKACEKGLMAKIFDAETLAAMETYHWPGNVREMENIVCRLSALCSDSIIGKEAFKAELRPEPSADIRTAQPVTLANSVEAHLKQYFAAHAADHLPPPGLYGRIMPLVEKPLIEMTLRATGGNQVKTAYVLGINRNTLRKKINDLRIDMSLFSK